MNTKKFIYLAGFVIFVIALAVMALASLASRLKR